MARFFPASSTCQLRIPKYSGAPNGGDLFTIAFRIYLPAQWAWSTGTDVPRIVTRREGAGAGAWVLQGSTTNPAPGTSLSFQAQYSGSGNIGAWDFPALSIGRWHDVMLAYDYSNWASTPLAWIDGAPVTLTNTHAVVSGTPNVHLNDIQVGNRLSTAAAAQSAIAELAWWKGRLLGNREANLVATYGPGAVPRSRTGWWNLDAWGPNYVPSKDGPHPMVPSSGVVPIGYATAPPRRKRRWWTTPGAVAAVHRSTSTITGTGAAHEGEYPSASGTETDPATGTAHAGEHASGSSNGITTASGTAHEGEHGSGSASEIDSATGTAHEGEHASTASATITATGTAHSGAHASATENIDFTRWTSGYTRTYTPTGDVYPYALYSPTPGDTTTVLPLVVYLDGSGSNGSDGWNQVRTWIGPLVQQRDAAGKWPYRVVAIQKPTTTTDENLGFRDVIPTIVNDVKALVAVDSTRIRILGISQGGFVGYALGHTYGDAYACMMQASGDMDPYHFTGIKGDTLSNALPIAQTGQLRRLPTWQAFGKLDPNHPYTDAEAIASAMQAVNSNWQYHEDPNGDHVGTWQHMFADETAWTWFGAQQRIAATGTAHEGEHANTPVATVGATGTAHEGEHGTATGAETLGASGTAHEGEHDAGTGALTDVGTGTGHEGEHGAGSTSGVTLGASGTAHEGEHDTGTGTLIDATMGTSHESEHGAGSVTLNDPAQGTSHESEHGAGAGLVPPPRTTHYVIKLATQRSRYLVTPIS